MNAKNKMPLPMGTNTPSGSSDDSDISDSVSDKGDTEIDPALLETLMDDAEDEDVSSESDDEDSDALSEDEDFPAIVWTGFNKRTPVLLFKADAIVLKKQEYRAIADQYHMTFKVMKTECKILRALFLAHGFSEVHPNSNDFNLMWTGSHIKPYVLRSLQDFQKVNHFPRSYELTRKDRLFKNVQRMQQTKGLKNFDFIPASYLIPGEFQDFCANFLKDKGPWIVKPVASSRGRGVLLVNHPDQVPLDDNVIVSKYIANPLLVDGFKFDIRFYVAVTSYDPLVIYLYEEGLTRFATVRYERNTKNLANCYMHLTNYSVNKKNPEFVSNDHSELEDYGNKWSLGAFLRYLRVQGKDTTALMMRIEDVIIKTLISTEMPICTATKMFVPFKSNCFELYGFDILIDDNLRPWLLEVNLSPSLNCDAPLDLKIKTHMIADLFSLVGVVCHDPLIKRNTASTFPSSGYRSDSTNNKTLYRPGGRPLSASRNQKPAERCGLTGEEIRIVRRCKEEHQRRGGWIRIFPSPDSWELYSAFLQYSTTYNLMLWQQLYPERSKVVSNKPSSAAYSSNLARTKSVHLHSAQYPQLYISTQLGEETNLKNYSKQYLLAKQLKDDALAQALQRSLQYERRLSALGMRHKKDSKQYNHVSPPPVVSNSFNSCPTIAGTLSCDTSPQKTKPLPPTLRARLAQGILNSSSRDGSPKKSRNSASRSRSLTRNEDESPAKDGVSKGPTQRSSMSHIEIRKDRSQSAASQQSPDNTNADVRSEGSRQSRADQKRELPQHPSQSKRHHKDMKKCQQLYNVLGELENGAGMSKLLARKAFSAYLTCIYDKILTADAAKDETLESSLDLVLRFLRRAAPNLRQPVEVVIPSSKLPLNERRRILAKTLGDFVAVYNKDTEVLKTKIKNDVKAGLEPPPLPPDTKYLLDEKRFEDFLFQATESHLEEVLTTYTRIHKSANIFLGVDKVDGPAVQEKAEAEEKSTSGFVKSVSGGGESDSGFSGGSQRPSLTSYNSAVSIYSTRLARSRPSSGKFNRPLNKITRGSRPASATSSQQSVPANNTESPEESEFAVNMQPDALASALQRLSLTQQSRHYSAGKVPNLLSASSKQIHPTLGVSPTSEEAPTSEMSREPVKSHVVASMPTMHFIPYHVPSVAQQSKSSGSINLAHSSTSAISAQRTSSQVSMAAFSMDSDSENSTFNSREQPSRTTSSRSAQFKVSEANSVQAASRAHHQVMVAQAHAAAQAVHSSASMPLLPDRIRKDMVLPRPPSEPSGDRAKTSHRVSRTQLAGEKASDSNFYTNIHFDTYSGTNQKPKMVYSSAYNTGF